MRNLFILGPMGGAGVRKWTSRLYGRRVLFGGRCGGKEGEDLHCSGAGYFFVFLCKIKLETRGSLPHCQSRDGAHCAVAPLQSCRIMYPLLDGYSILRAPTVARGAGRTRLLDVPSYGLLRLLLMYIGGRKGRVPRAYVLSLEEDQFL